MSDEEVHEEPAKIPKDMQHREKEIPLSESEIYKRTPKRTPTKTISWGDTGSSGSQQTGTGGSGTGGQGSGGTQGGPGKDESGQD